MSLLALPGRLDPAGEHLSLSCWVHLFWEAPLGLGALSCLLLAFLGLSCWDAFAGLESSPFSAGWADPKDKGCLALLGPSSHWCSPLVSPLHFSTEDAPRCLAPSPPSRDLRCTQAEGPLQCSLAVSWVDKEKVE